MIKMIRICGEMEEILDDTSVVNLDEDMGACTPPFSKKHNPI